MKIPKNDYARQQLWEADSYLVAADDGLRGAVPQGRWMEATFSVGTDEALIAGERPLSEHEAAEMPVRVAWQNVDCARYCLELAYTALTERDATEVEVLISEVAPLDPADELLAEDDPRVLKILELRKRLQAMLQVHQPSPPLRDTIEELRALCLALGFPHTS